MWVFLGLISGFINWLFGSGAGMIVLPGLISTYGLDSKKARGTSLFILIVVSTITSFFYVRNIPDYQALWFITAGGIAGGILGANYVKKIPDQYVRLTLAIIMIISGIRMILA